MKADDPGALVLPTLAALIVSTALLAGFRHPFELILLTAMTVVGIVWILSLGRPRGPRT